MKVTIQNYISPYKMKQFWSHLEASHFSYRSSGNEKPYLLSNDAQWTKKIVFMESVMFSDFDSEFWKFLTKLRLSFWDFTKFCSTMA